MLRDGRECRGKGHVNGMTLTRYTPRDDRLNNDVIDLEGRLLNDPIKM